MDMVSQHQSEECCESGEKTSSEYELPTINELNNEGSESGQHSDERGACHGDSNSGHNDHSDSESECTCCDTCEITSSGAQGPVKVLDEALTLDSPGAETYLYETEILLLPDHHQVATLQNVADDRSSPPLYLMNQVFLN